MPAPCRVNRLFTFAARPAPDRWRSNKSEQVPHPAVVRVFDCAALADGQVYLAMELLRGESLEQRLRRPGDAAEVVPLLAELARGLAAVHRVGVVHRDINYLLTCGRYSLLTCG